jgi:L,D-peptidoglycan transpeptidase YkuD (ErfK/YbiS/YcfS/YnhG family)
MIVINKSGYLKYKNLELKCTLGKAGVGIKKREGDNITPKGTYKILNIYYRKDRIKKISSKLKLIAITKQMGWCDDPDSKYYNKLIKLPTEYSHERFFRKDNVYDLVLALNYNMKPIIKNKGSAIFIHVAKKNKKTAGCIALSKVDLINLIKKIDKKTKIKIN